MTVSNIAQFLAFQFLLQRDWFCRVWIIQEISLAKDAILLCGDWEIPWATLFAAFEVLQVLPIGGRDVVDLGFDRLQRLGWSKENLSGTPLVAWLFVHRGAGATNPRDHVYALIGLADDGADFKVDYTKPVSEVFCDTARQILSSSQNLSLLNLVGNAQRRSDVTLPSWVPDWRTDMLYTPLLDHSVDPLEVHLELSHDGLKLEVLGIEVDPVALVGVCVPSVPNGSEYRQWHELLCHSSFYNWIETFQPFFATSYPTGGDPVHDVFWQVITENDSSSNMERGNLSFRKLSFRLENWVTNIPISFSSPIRQVFAFILLFFPLFVPLQLCCRLLTGKKLPPFRSSVNTFGRRMIRTKSGILGLALEDTQVGDKVFLLHGGLTPMVLRRSLSCENAYELVGECYLHGFMDKLAADVGECHKLSIV
jgi:hypothetical protein